MWKIGEINLKRKFFFSFRISFNRTGKDRDQIVPKNRSKQKQKQNKKVASFAQKIKQ